MQNVLPLVMGVCWTITYVLIIRRGFADRTFGMPIVALCANISWEFIFAVVRPPAKVFPLAIYLTWFTLDAVIVYTVLRFGPREFPNLPRPLFYTGFAATLVLSYIGVDAVSRELDDGGGALTAFGSNLMMGALFLAMLTSRRGLRGQSIGIATAKFVGTAFASLYNWRYVSHPDAVVFAFLYIGNAVVDVAYLAAVVVLRQRQGAPLAQPQLAATVA
jgi:hypothetical protein